MSTRIILVLIGTSFFVSHAMAGNYQTVNIVAPAVNETIHDNSGDLSVRLAIAPQLDSNSGDYLTVMVDGKQAATGSTLDYSLAHIDRGSHTLQVQVHARDGSTLLSSPEVPFNMWQASALFRSRKR